MSRKRTAKPQGQIRQSQIVTTFGPGAMVDLPKHSVLVAGLDYWSKGGDEIIEPRLTEQAGHGASASRRSGSTRRRRTRDDPTAALDRHRLLPVPGVVHHPGRRVGRSEILASARGMLVHRKALTNGKFLDRNEEARRSFPVRFVRACRYGHIGDINWYYFVHGGDSDCAAQRRQLWIDERGTSGDLSEVWIRCECGKAERNMSQATLATKTPARALRRLAALARAVHQGTVRRAESAADPHGQQRLFPAVDERHLAARPRRNGQTGGDAAWEFLEAVESYRGSPVRAEESQGQAGAGGHQRRRGFRRDPGPPRRRRSKPKRQSGSPSWKR